jgi:hypothetical protein
VSGYPTPIEQTNLRRLDALARHDTVIGISDHSLGAIAAVARGAAIIEKHLTLARADGAPTQGSRSSPPRWPRWCAARGWPSTRSATAARDGRRRRPARGGSGARCTRPTTSRPASADPGQRALDPARLRPAAARAAGGARPARPDRDHLAARAPLIAAVQRSPALAGGLRAGTGTLATDDAAVAFRRLAQTLVRIDLEQLRGVERTAAQHTQPLWVQRDAAAAEG